MTAKSVVEIKVLARWPSGWSSRIHSISMAGILISDIRIEDDSI
jgi:hypothetical protein